jgi:GntR family transcriptional regulator/MocR family aminotransferase
LATPNHPFYTNRVVHQMQVLSSLINIDQAAPQAVYIQIACQFQKLIQEGALQANARLPSTRDLSSVLKVHRKTVVKAYDELLTQGWVQSHQGNGTFVAANLPEMKVQGLNNHC